MCSCIKQLYDYDLVRTCSKCANISLRSIFYKISKSKDGLQSQCKFCVNEYNKNYYNRNRKSELEHCKKIIFKIVER